MEEIGPEFFERNPLVCARELIGCVFRWHGCEGRIVETEAYAEFDDPACHTWTRPSARDFIRRHEAGAAYIYLNYGVHWLFNVLTKGPDESGFVLFRALEPVSGLNEMRKRRGNVKDHHLCSGPGKLTQALAINQKDHGCDFLERSTKGIFRGPKVTVQTGGRIGISRAADRPWRFGAEDSKFLSRKF